MEEADRGMWVGVLCQSLRNCNHSACCPFLIHIHTLTVAHTHMPPPHHPHTHTGLQRIERDLVIEQGEIRADIQRIANQLELLNAEIQSRVARNTGCLDIGTTSKRRRKRSRRHQLQ